MAGLRANLVLLSADRAANPLAFTNKSLLSEYKTVNFNSPLFPDLHSANFFYPFQRVASISTSMEPKRGMGHVWYSGRILVTLINGKMREFILLGSQEV